jgi:hypothetical protein
MLVIEIPKTDLPELKSLADEQGLKCEIVETDRFDGTGVDLVNVLLPVTLTTITSATTVIVQLIRQRRRPKIKMRGIEITDMSEENLLKVISQHIGKS